MVKILTVYFFFASVKYFLFLALKSSFVSGGEGIKYVFQGRFLKMVIRWIEIKKNTFPCDDDLFVWLLLILEIWKYN